MPIPFYFYPDTNFTFMSFGFPTAPQDQILANQHLYAAMGCYVVIYEVQQDGRLAESGQIMTNSLICKIDHDGDYLYISGEKGIAIYDGTNYTDPQIIGQNPLRYLEISVYLKVWGDSLYYWWDDSSWGGIRFGIMDVHDRTNPQTVAEFDSIGFGDNKSGLVKYDHYLYIPMRVDDYQIGIAIFDLNDTVGVPSYVGNIRVHSRKFKLFGNRLYLCTYDDLKIYEFTSGFTPELRSELPMPDDIHDIAEVEIGGNRFGYVCSWDGFAYKINLNDLANPIIVDSLVMPVGQHDFRDIEQFGDYSYAMTTGINYFVYHPGIHVIDWTAPGGPDLVQTAKKYSKCETVKAIGDVIYAATTNDNIVVVDVANKSNPQVIDLPYSIWGYHVKGDSNTLYAQNGNTVKFYDLSDPLAPIHDRTCEVPINYPFIIYDYIVYDTLLIANYTYYNYTGPGGLIILGISDPDNVNVLFDDHIRSRITPLHLNYPKLYFASNSGFNPEIEIFDISDPTNPISIHTIYYYSASISNVYTYENYVYVAGGLNRIYHWNDQGQLIFDRSISFSPYNLISANGKIFYHGLREGAEGRGVQVWEASIDPVYPTYSGYYYSSVGPIGTHDKIDVEWPYVYIPGGRRGVEIIRYDNTVDIVEEDGPNLPQSSQIEITAFPNPFNSSTTIKYILPEPGHVRIDIYDLLGRKVRTLVEKDKPAGAYTVIFEASGLSSGVYFSRIHAGNEIQTRQMVLLK
ncbi:MAG: T9SS type A sorting domain-containing protein [Candidatus Zixiibacteriota bacterium]|nr:MAG: T9SS type A sorting domain-containing protein [candidate division Zixibacteria bacterium]